MAIMPATNTSIHASYLCQRQRNLSSSGHQQQTSKLNIRGSIIQPVSDAQRRAAQLELDRMNESTSRLLQMTSVPVSDSIVNESRVALHYWSRRWYMHHHPGFGRAAKGSQLSLQALRQWDVGKYDNNNNMTNVGRFSANTRLQHERNQKTAEQHIQQGGGDHGARQAERLLDWSIENNLIPHGIFDPPTEGSYIKTADQNVATSPNLTCANIVQTYLLPCEWGGFGGSNELVHGDSYGFTNDAALPKNLIANASYVRALADATRVIKKMKQLHATYPDQISPDTLSIVTELSVWSKRAILLSEILSKDIVAGSNVGSISSNLLELLNSLEHDIEDSLDLRHDKYTLQGCLDHMETILADAENRYTSTNDDRIRPSIDCYNHIIGAWARSDLDVALGKLKQYLYGMEQYGETEVSNTDIAIRRCWAKPNTITYNGVLFCLARGRQGRGHAKAAQEMLKNMKERYQKTNDESIRPDDVTYGTVLHALAQAGMAEEAESILDSLEDDYNAVIDNAEADEQGIIPESVVVPGLTIYNSVLNAWANSFQRNAAERSESLLNRMKVLHQTGRNADVDPDMISLSTVMKCHAQSKSKEGTERAEELLDQAIAMYHQGNLKVKPDSIMFNCALLGWASISGVDGQDQGGMAAERAELLLRKMKSLREDSSVDIHQDTQSFNIVLDCVSSNRFTCFFFSRIQFNL
jgi:pentatricopeptide repeat protein